MDHKDGISRKLQWNQSRGLKLAIAKRCRLHKLIRQRFAFVRFSRWFCAKNQQVQLSRETSSRKLKYQSQRSRRNDDFSSSAKTEDQPSRKLCISSRSTMKRNYQSTGLQRSENQTQKRNSCCAKCCDKEKTTAERTAVEQFVGEYSAIQTQSTLKMEESMAEIKSCILPGIKGTRFVLFWEIVQFTEEHCTHLERR
ncbi:hypothetical protein F511_43879 [Dorcoceras hygrometricum]|uniref:Uncharacterized protein n=1 Tax=Dorcoceras hygrometricum TaxID=472368 RepID=A0A2Z7A368_9LAMI|nr:hypothetical protein F511_43879 [Dorcoceras hygrometricum]